MYNAIAFVCQVTVSNKSKKMKYKRLYLFIISIQGVQKTQKEFRKMRGESDRKEGASNEAKEQKRDTATLAFLSPDGSQAATSDH